MFSDLKNYLTRIVAEPQVLLYTHSVETLHRHYGDKVVFLMDELIKEAQHYDTQTTINQLNDVIIGYAIDALKGYGIYINHDIIEYSVTKSLVDILYTITELDVYEDYKRLKDIIEDEVDNTEAIAEMVSIITDSNIDEVRSLLERVDNALIHKLIDIYNEKEREAVTIDEQIILHPVLNEYIHSDYIKFVDKDIASIVVQPYKLSIKSILRLFGNKLADDKSSQYSWMFILLMSEESKDNIDLNNLYYYWDKHFINERDKMDAKLKLGKLYDTLIGE